MVIQITVAVIPDYGRPVRIRLKDFETEFLDQRSDSGLTLSDPLTAKIDPAFSFPADVLREHATAYAVPGLQDHHRSSLLHLQDSSGRHEPGEPSTYNDDISHAHPYQRRE
jgi:hypothetical protein